MLCSFFHILKVQAGTPHARTNKTKTHAENTLRAAGRRRCGKRRRTGTSDLARLWGAGCERDSGSPANRVRPLNWESAGRPLRREKRNKTERRAADGAELRHPRSRGPSSDVAGPASRRRRVPETTAPLGDVSRTRPGGARHTVRVRDTRRNVTHRARPVAASDGTAQGSRHGRAPRAHTHGHSHAQSRSQSRSRSRSHSRVRPALAPPPRGTGAQFVEKPQEMRG